MKCSSGNKVNKRRRGEWVALGHLVFICHRKLKSTNSYCSVMQQVHDIIAFRSAPHYHCTHTKSLSSGVIGNVPVESLVSFLPFGGNGLHI